jgi:hypothetical protein
MNDGKKIFLEMNHAGIIEVAEINDSQIKIRILKLHPTDPYAQRHLLDLFADILTKYVSDIRLCTHLPLNDLLTGRKVKQENFADGVIQECLSPELMTELAEWDISLTGRLETSLYGDIPVILFQLFHGNKTIAEISLDGWCGLILVDGFPRSFSMPRFFNDAEDFQAAARAEAYAYLERLTS